MAGRITLPHFDVVSKWKVHQVTSWLKKVGLNDCVAAFEDRCIDGTMLLELTEQKLFGYQDLKIKHRSQIAKCVSECNSHSSQGITVTKAGKCTLEEKNYFSALNRASSSDSDSDDWDTDFGDDDDLEVGVNGKNVEQLNNNTVKEQSMVEPEFPEKSSDSNSNTLRNKQIPKPPDLPLLVSKLPNENDGRKHADYKSTISRPPVKRPLSQPPPPPSQPSCVVRQQEEYEIPINPTCGIDVGTSKTCLDNFATMTLVKQEVPLLPPKQLSNECSSSETYEVIETPEENYEIVDESRCLPSVELTSGPVSSKPSLPPRISPALSISPPPPLPQKPYKLQNFVGQQADLSKATLKCIPIVKNEESVEKSDSTELGNGLIFSSLIARKYSIPSALTPPQNGKNFSGSDPTVFASASSPLLSEDNLSRSSTPDKEVPFPISSVKYLSSSMSSVTIDSPISSSPPPLPPRYVSTFSEDTAQLMATRPLPPVPTSLNTGLASPVCCIQEEVCFHPWFHEIERSEAELQIKNMAANGAFLVRPSKRAGKENPFTLTVLHDGKIFHLNIRQRPDNTFALGKRKAKEKIFNCVPELISFHQKEPIILTSRGESAGQAILKIFPTKQ